MKTVKIITVVALAAMTVAVSAKPEGKKDRASKGKHRMPEFVVDAYDTDGDGSLNEIERKTLRSDIEARRDEAKAQYDTDGDGTLNDDERAVMRDQKKTEALAKFDEDSSGSLDETEKKAMMEELKENDPLAALAVMCHCKKGGDKGKRGPKKGKGGPKSKKGPKDAAQ